MKTIAYVDGFNLYFGALRGTPYKWLNPPALLQRIFPQAQFERVKYFTAKVVARPSDPDQPTRQRVYLRALATVSNLEVFFGHFLTHEVHMPLVQPTPGGRATVKVFRTDEKGSDVNLATQLVHDAHLGRFQQAIVVSGDSDLLMPIQIVAHELKKTVGVLNPQRHPCVVLQQHASFYKHLRPAALVASQFPPQLTDAHGTFHKPASW